MSYAGVGRIRHGHDLRSTGRPNGIVRLWTRDSGSSRNA